MERQSTEQEKIFSNHISDKALISETHKKLILFNSKKNNTIKKRAERSEETFFQKRMQMDNRYMKRCSASLIVREMQI